MIQAFTERQLRQKLSFLITVKRFLFAYNFFIWVRNRIIYFLYELKLKFK